MNYATNGVRVCNIRSGVIHLFVLFEEEGRALYVDLNRFALQWGDKMKIALSLAFCFAVLGSGCANLDERENSILGGAVGGAAGAAGGYEVGGRDGAIVGAGAGAASGVAVGANRAVVEERTVRGYERDRRGDREDNQEEHGQRHRRDRDD